MLRPVNHPLSRGRRPRATLTRRSPGTGAIQPAYRPTHVRGALVFGFLSRLDGMLSVIAPRADDAAKTWCKEKYACHRDLSQCHQKGRLVQLNLTRCDSHHKRAVLSLLAGVEATFLWVFGTIIPIVRL